MQSSDKNRYYWLDWVRFLAAFQVLICHVRGGHLVEYGALASEDKGWLTALAFALSRLGHEAVVVFFVLSGYLLGGRSLQRAIEGRFDVPAYWLDRFTRIYVPLVPALGMTALVVFVQGDQSSMTELLVNLAGMQGVDVKWGVFGGNAPLWSLAFEMWFYALWGCTLAAATSPSSAVRAVHLLLTVVSFIVLSKLGAVHYLFCWLLGALAHQLGANLHRACLLNLGIFSAAVGTILTQLNSGSVSVNLTRWQPWIPSLATSVLILAAGFALLANALASWQPNSERVRCWEQHGKFWADFSYTLYLTHFVLLGLWGHYFPGRADTVSLATCAVLLLKTGALLAVCWGLFYCFERNTGAVRKWLRIRIGMN